jgi:hypothetical protein
MAVIIIQNRAEGAVLTGARQRRSPQLEPW